MLGNRLKRSGFGKGLVVLAVTAGFGASFVIAYAIGAVGSDVPRSAGDGLTHTSGRGVVATGTSREFGRWELVVSQSDKGRCEGVRLLDDGRSEPTVYEGCGLPPGFSLASLAGARATFVHGRVPPDAEEVSISMPGEATQTARTRRAPDGSRFIGVDIPAGARGVSVEAFDAGGRSLGSREVPTAADGG
ncbi:MAG TPA: hypothetical protein VNT32_12805 [Thermoleophilaceae bacterium]|nr:hypothetical protein [Thermoleophilaceae bacterium]